VSTVAKALALLNLVAAEEEEKGLSELARLAGMDKATTRRMLVELETHGFLEQDAVTRRYRIGAAPVRLARIREARVPLLRAAIPFVKELAQATGETCHLAEFSGGALHSLHVEDCPKAHRVIVDVGVILPLHATASGLAFLASLPHQAVEALLGEPLEAFTDATVTDLAVLRQRLDETRKRGWSINRNGLEAGVVSVAAAVLGADRRPIATLAIAAPDVRIDAPHLEELGLKVADAAGRLSARLNGNEGAPSAPLKMIRGMRP
jgi:IclR family transcriptional regulator, acetate operon repressor